MADLLPDAVRLRTRKALFDSLLIDCLAGPDAHAVNKLLSNPAAELGAYVDMQEMRRTLLEGGPAGAPNAFRWMYQVWRLVTAECWLRTQAGRGGEALRAELRSSAPRVEMTAVPA